jgi:hypothetical protein
MVYTLVLLGLRFSYLFGCEIWPLTLREEHRPRILRRIFGSKRDEVTGGWRKLHNELHNLYSSPSIIEEPG